MTEGARNPRIIRVFSNNAVLVRVPSGVPREDTAQNTAHNTNAKNTNTNENTQVLVGRGIGFQRKPGDEISPATADRQYLELSPERAQFLKGVLSLDPAVMETISAAVDLAVDLLGGLHPSVYVVLAEHISFAVQRAGSGEQIRNSLVDEIRAAFPWNFRRRSSW